MTPEEENLSLRELLAVRVAGTCLYRDDKELQDNTEYPCIDFIRDSVEEIRQKLKARFYYDLHKNKVNMDIESQIQASAPTKPRLTMAHIESRVARTTFNLLPSGKVIVCELLLQNGFSVRGESAVVYAENFRMDIGERIARENAIDKIWELEGYLLQQRLHEEFMLSLAQ